MGAAPFRGVSGRVLRLSVSVVCLTGAAARASDEITITLPGDVPLVMVRIPAGTFTMGSPDEELGRSADEGPQHQVTISEDFYIGKYEVTQEQWEAVMAHNPSSIKSPKNPVENISWNDCWTFI